MSPKNNIHILIITIFLLGAALFSPCTENLMAEETAPVYVNVLVLDYTPVIGEADRLKFQVETVTSGDPHPCKVYAGRILTLPISDSLRGQVFLFDRANLGIARDETGAYAGNFKVIEKYHREIQLPLGLKTDLFSDEKTYTKGQKVKMTILAKNTGKETITLPLPSAKQFDFVVRNAKGQEVWRWSSGKLFITMYQSMIFALREEKKFEYIWNMKDNNGKPVPKGTYTIEGCIATEPMYPAGRGRVSIVIK